MRVSPNFRAYHTIDIIFHRHTVYHMQLVYNRPVIFFEFILIEKYIPHISARIALQCNHIRRRRVVGRHKGTLCPDARRYTIFLQLHSRTAELYYIITRRYHIIRLFLDGIRTFHCNFDWIRIMWCRKQYADERIIRRSHRRPGRHKGSQKHSRQHAHAHQRRF